MASTGGRKKRVGRYEMGRTIGQGSFAKVKFAVDSETGTPVAMKVIDKDTILSHRMLHQVLRRRALTLIPVLNFSGSLEEQIQTGFQHPISFSSIQAASFPLSPACPFNSGPHEVSSNVPSEERWGIPVRDTNMPSIIESNASDTVNPTNLWVPPPRDYVSHPKKKAPPRILVFSFSMFVTPFSI
jgi:hypothetical protein